jgi:peptidoglycan/xylan/chitin deacetylase (PgdA/CDA1 family)
VPEVPHVQIFNLHHVFDDEIDAFRGFVGMVQERYRIATYSDAMRVLQEGPLSERIAVFSFDDGLESCYNAAKVLDEFGVSGMFFLCPSMQEDANDEDQAAFCEQRLLMKPMRFLSWAQIEGMKSRGHEFGNHTWSHPKISTISSGQAVEEIGKGKEAIEKRVGECKHFAWPFGQFEDFNAEAAKAVFELGHESCASAVRGAHVRPEGRFCCPRRDHVVAGWRFSHVAYFIRKNVVAAGTRNDSWPEGWSEQIG